jgi:two-component system, OmpR family, response regulator
MENKKVVLLVDDDEDYLFQQKTCLEQLNFKVIIAYNEDEAKEILKNIEPNLALIDLMMKEMDGGFVLAYHIKKKFPHIPVIITTAVTQTTGLSFESITPQEKSWIKADIILQKPVRFEQLRSEIERLMLK